MALTIQGATIGYDSEGVQGLLQAIRAQVIEEASNRMQSSLETLNQAVDDVWVGQSADRFKANMQTDVTKIRDALDRTYEALQSEIAQIVNEMGKVDQNLIESR